MRSQIVSLVLSLAIIFNVPLASADFDSDLAAAPNSTTERLEYFIQKAQQAYFSGEDQNLARSYFEQVALLKNDPQLSREQIKVIHFSMLRLSQLSLAPAQMDQWILTSQQFAPDLIPDSELFPPPVTKRFYELRKDLKVANQNQSLPPVSENSAREETREVEAGPNPKNYVTEIETPLTNETPFWKNKWVWIGAGVLIASAVIYDQNQGKKENSETTVTYGF